jgi:hypothetical protein
VARRPSASSTSSGLCGDRFRGQLAGVHTLAAPEEVGKAA